MSVSTLAGTVAQIAFVRASTGSSVTAGEVKPIYVRRPDAVVAREAATLDSPAP
jgi:hypothetical protein